MMLTITEKDKFLNTFLIPISKVSDSVILKIVPGSITTLIATSDNTIIVNATYNDTSINITKVLNVPDIKKFCRILSCIEESTLIISAIHLQQLDLNTIFTKIILLLYQRLILISSMHCSLTVSLVYHRALYTRLSRVAPLQQRLISYTSLQKET